MTCTLVIRDMLSGEVFYQLPFDKDYEVRDLRRLVQIRLPFKSFHMLLNGKLLTDSRRVRPHPGVSFGTARIDVLVDSRASISEAKDESSVPLSDGTELPRPVVPEAPRNTRAFDAGVRAAPLGADEHAARRPEVNAAVPEQPAQLPAWRQEINRFAENLFAGNLNNVLRIAIFLVIFGSYSLLVGILFFVCWFFIRKIGNIIFGPEDNQRDRNARPAAEVNPLAQLQEYTNRLFRERPEGVFGWVYDIEVFLYGLLASLVPNWQVVEVPEAGAHPHQN